MQESNKVKTCEDGVPETTDDEGRRIELWPGMNCPACRNGEEVVRWETSSYAEDDDTAPNYQQYDGRKPCCIRCGTRLPERIIDSYRPPEWQQPILRVASGVRGMNVSHPATRNLTNAYESDPLAFLNAAPDELTEVNGIGDTFADRIHTTRATLYPELTPNVDGYLYEFRGRRLCDVAPTTLAGDLLTGHIDSDELPDEPADGAAEVLQETASLLRDRSENEHWTGAHNPESVREIADAIVSN